MTMTANDHPYRVTAVDSASKYANDHPIKVEIEGGVVTPDEFEELEKKVDALATDLSYKGGVEDYEHLPQNPETGDVYTTEDTGTLYVWDGTEWVALNEASSETRYFFLQKDENSFPRVVGSGTDFESAVKSGHPVVVVPYCTYQGWAYYQQKSPIIMTQATNPQETMLYGYGLSMDYNDSAGRVIERWNFAKSTESGEVVYRANIVKGIGLEVVNDPTIALGSSAQFNDFRPYNAWAVRRMIGLVNSTPTSSTVGYVGQILINGQTAEVYQCKSIDTSTNPYTYVWGDLGGQPDWFESDSTSSGYIKNRTHYDTLHKKYYPDDSATYTPSFPSVNGVTYNSNDPSAWLNELGSQWAVLDPQGINPAYSPVAIDTSYGRIQASKDIHYMEMEDVSWLREGMTDTDIICKGSPMFVSEADFERVWYSNGMKTLHQFNNVEDGHTIFASGCTGTNGQGFTIWFIDNQVIIASDKWDSSTNYVYFKSATGTLKELDSKYLPAATSDKKGAIKLSEVGDAVAVGEGLKKYTNGQGLTELAIADGGTADYEESDSSATTYIQNRPFYDGSSVTKSINLGPKYSVYWNTSSTYYSGIETWLTSSMGSAYFSIDGGVRVVKSDGNFFAPDEEFVTAIINGGQVDMTLTYEDMMMMTTTEYHLTNLTFTKINDAAYGTEFIGATWRDGHFRPILVRADVAARLSGGSLIPYTVDDGWFLFMAYNLNGYLQLDSIYSSGTNEATFTLTTPIKQLDAKYVPIDGTTIVNDNGVLKASGGPTVVQTTGTSTADVMSQDATTKMVYGSSYGGTRQGIYINPSTGVVRNVFLGGYDNAGTATEIFAVLGGDARNAGVVTFGKAVSVKGIFNIRTSGSTNGYNNSDYRLLTGLYDPQTAHDAATKGYVDAHSATTLTNTEFNSILENA